ncbi:MAG TPA: DUF2339 domain-containing protein [Gemmatimonadaceae bacterium]|nr:DUF2339 domain-containing protein [Gemmatimonadaceae bacterium]
MTRLASRLDAASPEAGAVPPPRPAAPVDTATPAPPRPAAAPAEPWSDVEGVVGRYGVLALGTVTTLAAVGTFVSWAAARGLLGPTTRVVLGLMLAAVLGVAGFRLRSRERSFGSALLGLALAVVHVCAWAAGPALHLVPLGGAFALAAGASIALAAFAHVQGDEILWCVGFGGAAVAPFVTAGPEGSALMLASYGTVIGVAGAVGIGARAWRTAERVLATAVALFAVVLAARGGAWGPALAVALPLAVAAAGVLPAAPAEFVRSRLRAMGVIGALAALWLGARGSALSPASTSLLVGAAALAWLVLLELTADAPALAPQGGNVAQVRAPAWMDGAAIPLMLAFATGEAVAPGPWSHTRVAAAAAVLLTVAVWRRGVGALRDALAFAVAACALVGAYIAPWGRVAIMPATVAGLGVAFAGGLRWRPSRSWLLMMALALTGASAYAWVLMLLRPAFAYRPFATPESLAAAAALAGWAVVAWMGPALAAAVERASPDAAGAGAGDARAAYALVRAAPWCWAFLWAHQELAAAVSAATASLALVSLEAGTAVLAVGIGRARDARWLRRAGLLLAVVAAVRALAAARTVPSVGVRIASYLVASAFLLGIAYWYRRRGAGAA